MSRKIRSKVSLASVLSGFACFVDLDQNFVASGRVPKELANLTNLMNLSLYGNQLQVPDGAPLESDGDIGYDSRDAVAAFQACLN